MTEFRAHLKSTHYEEVRATIDMAVKKGLETWIVDMRFTREGVALLSCVNTIRDAIKD